VDQRQFVNNKNKGNVSNRETYFLAKTLFLDWQTLNINILISVNPKSILIVSKARQFNYLLEYV